MSYAYSITNLQQTLRGELSDLSIKSFEDFHILGRFMVTFLPFEVTIPQFFFLDVDFRIGGRLIGLHDPNKRKLVL